jgi:hypothetical protein
MLTKHRPIASWKTMESFYILRSVSLISFVRCWVSTIYGTSKWKLFQPARAPLITTAGHSQKTPLHLSKHISYGEKPWSSFLDLICTSHVPFTCLFSSSKTFSLPFTTVYSYMGPNVVFPHRLKDVNSATLMHLPSLEFVPSTRVQFKNWKGSINA